jgi:hypothetical protein
LSSRVRRSLAHLLRSERGIALPMALMVTVVGMGLAAVPVVASINSQGGDQHNQGANEALAAAETGAEIALREQGALHIKEGSNRLCVSTAGVTSGWCPEEPRPENGSAAVPGTVGLATYTYRVLPCYGTDSGFAGCAAVASSVGCTEAPVEVVATGTAQVGGLPVERRVKVTGCAGSFSLPPEWEFKREQKRTEVKTLEEELAKLEAPGEALEAKRTAAEQKRTSLEETIRKEEAEGKKETENKTGYKEESVTHEIAPPVFSGGQVVGIEGLTMNNGANVYNGGAGSNTFVHMTGNANVCGTVRYVTEYTATNGSNNPPSNCAGGRTFLKASAYTYPLVQLPTEIEKKNSDSRLTGLDPASGYNRGNVAWNESKKELSLNYGELTLEGTLPYYFCRVVLGGGGILKSGVGKTIRLFFENPNKCPGLNGAAQLVISNGAEVLPDSGHGPGFYFVGAASTEKEQSKIELAGGSKSTQLVIYGPRSKINANNGIKMSGTIIGQTLEIAGGASVNEKGAFTPPTSTEFVAPETVTEKVKVPTSETVTTELFKHKEEKRKLNEEILKITQEIEAINKAPIEEKEKKLAEKETELSAWEELANPGSGASGNTSFKKSSFTECTATPPNSSSPASGC